MLRSERAETPLPEYPILAYRPSEFSLPGVRADEQSCDESHGEQ